MLLSVDGWPEMRNTSFAKLQQFLDFVAEYVDIGAQNVARCEFENFAEFFMLTDEVESTGTNISVNVNIAISPQRFT